MLSSSSSLPSSPARVLVRAVERYEIETASAIEAEDSVREELSRAEVDERALTRRGRAVRRLGEEGAGQEGGNGDRSIGDTAAVLNHREKRYLDLRRKRGRNVESGKEQREYEK